MGLLYDEGGKIAATGTVQTDLLQQLNALSFYTEKAPKSLSNSFGISVVLPIIENENVSKQDALRTYVEHIAMQIKAALVSNLNKQEEGKILITGGGALNTFLIERLTDLLGTENITVVVPQEQLVQYKEALIMSLMGVLRWREEANVLSSVTGAAQNSIGGALWLGTEA